MEEPLVAAQEHGGDAAETVRLETEAPVVGDGAAEEEVDSLFWGSKG